MSTRKYSIGIDLGTTNSVLSYCDLEAEEPQVQLLEVPQLVAEGTVEKRASLPSFLYIAAEHELGKGALQLSWEEEETPFLTGEIARQRSAETPMRTISAAKSWLCYHKIDRHGKVLPWNAPAEIPKISPVEVTTRYLKHLVAAWNANFPKEPMHEQMLVLTVPASFDAGARDLTRQAALDAGLPEDLVLLEEPQSALYAWLAHHGEDWRKLLKVDDCVLVCDVGGGTTDFSLIKVVNKDGELALERIAVGTHLLVGGDNMDLSLAHIAKQAFADQQQLELDPWQSVSLWHACRAAKEVLLSKDGPETHPVTILGRGSKLIGDTVSIDLHKDDAFGILNIGFFPECTLNEKPHKRFASGFRELGLPYESDAAITRHLAAFLSSQQLAPTHVLFNGGVFRADAFRERLMRILSTWFEHEPQLLEGKQDLDFAVAYGASYYGSTKQKGGSGIRIRGGTARSYYVGIESAGLAVPGMERPLQGLCVSPFGMEEGSEADVPGHEIGLVLGEEAQFRFFSSVERTNDRPGDFLPAVQELQESDPITATLPAAEGLEQDYVPVTFHTKVTELGMLELWCHSTTSDEKWKLEFNARERE